MASTQPPSGPKRRLEKREKFVIHWAFKFVAWVLCFVLILVGIFFLWAYAIQFGNDKTYQWLSSMLVGLFAGILIFDPLKVSIP